MPKKEVKARLMREGKCTNCARVKTELDGDFAHCLFCRELARTRYATKSENGICVYAGCQEPATYKVLCTVHFLQQKEVKAADKKNRRLRGFAAYGGCKCNCPGCTCTIYEFMTFDHINGDGAKHRKEVCGDSRHGSSDRILRDLEKRGWPQGIVQPMCASCNYAKRVGSACPYAGRPHVELQCSQLMPFMSLDYLIQFQMNLENQVPLESYCLLTRSTIDGIKVSPERDIQSLISSVPLI